MQDSNILGSVRKDEICLFLYATTIRCGAIDPLLWRSSNSNRFPDVLQLARKLLSVPSLSVASESTFSIADHALGPGKASLSDESLTSLVCLKFQNKILPKQAT